MPCYRPNIRVANMEPVEHGLKSTTMGFINSLRKDFPGYEYFEKLQAEQQTMGYKYEWQKVPCGECEGCQENYSKGWAVRCLKEAEKYKHNWFITITYDDDHLPLEDGYITDPKTGVEYQYMDPTQGHLEPDDLKKFIKDIRRYWQYHYDEEEIRFFACGEYGGQTKRPHYHAVLFNIHIRQEDLDIYKIQTDGTTLWNCKILDNIWGKGYVVLAEVNWDTCAYVARYVMKKQGGVKQRCQYFEEGMTPEFIRMSRMPGIGLDYFESHLRDIYENDEIIIKGHRNKIGAARPPSYYDRKFDELYPEKMIEIKDRRKIIASIANEVKNAKSSLPEAERLKVEQRIKKGTWESLKRNKV